MSNILTLWNIGLVSSEAVVAWADDQILKWDEAPQPLIELSIYGPKACLRRPEFDFAARPLKLPFETHFSALAIAADTSSDSTALGLAKWVAYQALGHCLDEPFVLFGYRVFHLLDDCNDCDGAVDLLRIELPKMLPRCRQLAGPLLDSVPHEWISSPSFEGHGSSG
jgi:hypothetical protein